jgi:hypothetical protein
MTNLHDCRVVAYISTLFSFDTVTESATNLKRHCNVTASGRLSSPIFCPEYIGVSLQSAIGAARMGRRIGADQQNRQIGRIIGVPSPKFVCAVHETKTAKTDSLDGNRVNYGGAECVFTKLKQANA